ncbi:1-acyl-sn-glycerol-3-phosphate acyltransferase [Chishuiella changwenlii]|jgi:1-acyl-sn-glycerol-3-phosphate acyltransferase|uniref:1-acyl-sn-glycerol-3-phosphate acyltransferase n=2 Tax=Chishuiella changwenlii TaxID=1434701 RepID=A0A1M6UZ60_9FLAO|nr:1-acyl-sn-glycerol-3-phosphate acyltransferase [Chishuiella changwenlii]SHK74346.1 1-acyl-sn-glycerol-3-phosphate acyltransferase [Chishuiella changwenlii]
MHVIQWLCYNIGGYKAHHKSVKLLNRILVDLTKIFGTSYTYSGRENLIKGVPLIFVSNHQSMYDVSPMEYDLSEYHPKFISKIELGSGIPSVSYNLRHGGSALIDRKNGKQAIEEIKKLALYIQENNYSAIIYPEGTRSKDGKPKPFKENGLKVLTKYAKDAYIVPVTINNTWQITQNGSFPLYVGAKVNLHYHKPLKVSDYKFDELLALTEQTVKNSITA